jgi:hypothetical protein
MKKADRKAIEATFGGECPRNVMTTYEFADKEGPAIARSFYFEVYGSLKVEDWFGKDRVRAKRFLCFGVDLPFSLYGFWLYGDRTLANAPIAFLDHDRKHSRVLANTFEEFLSLLAVGYPEPGRVDKWSKAEADEQDDDLDKFRAFVKKELGIEPARDPKALVEKAAAAHPDLNAWLQGKAEDEGAAAPGKFPGALTELRSIITGPIQRQLDLWGYESFNETYKPSDWTRNKASDETLFTFGKDGVGGQALIWMRNPKAPLLENPVAFLGRDGEVAVIATTFAKFARLLSLGIGPFAIASDGVPEEPKPVPAIEAWAKRHFSGAQSDSSEAIIGEGKKRLAEFKKLVRRKK